MKQQSTFSIILILLILLVLGSSSVLLANRSTSSSMITPTPTLSQQAINTKNHSTLQLQTFTLATPVPSVTKAQVPTITTIPPTLAPPPPTADICSIDTGQQVDLTCQCQDYKMQCQNKVCVKLYQSGLIPNPPATGCPSALQQGQTKLNFDGYCKLASYAPTDGIYCIAKPVIYLYPPSPLFVTVTLTIPGVVTRSDPRYPQNGWNNVFAFPDGTLEYNGKTYHELFYESAVNKHEVANTGWLVKRSDVSAKLAEITHIFNLNANEQQELLAYWLPKLQAINSPYLFIGILTPEQKDNIDHVTIVPQPDTRIEFLLYFKGTNSFRNIQAPKLSSPPQRRGFTEVEWGGTIDSGS